MPVTRDNIKDIYGKNSEKFRAALASAGITIPANEAYMLSLAKAFKFYANPDKYTTKDILLNNAEIEPEDIEEMISFFSEHSVKLDGNEPDEKQKVDMETIEEFGKQFLHAVRDIKTDEVSQYSSDDLKEIETTYQTYNRAFRNYSGRASQYGRYVNSPDVKLDNAYKAFMQQADRGTYGSGYEISDAIMRRMYMPVTMGKTMEQIGNMFPFNYVSGSRNALSELRNSLSGLDTFILEKYQNREISETQIKNFMETGELPENVKEGFQAVFNQGYARFKAEYRGAIANGDILVAPPVQFDSKDIPDYQEASLMIAADAMQSLRVQDPSMKDEDLAQYRNIVQMQIEKNLLESGYLEKCKQHSLEDINGEIRNFTGGGKEFPLGFNTEIINKSIETAHSFMHKEIKVPASDLLLVDTYQTFLGQAKNKNQVMAVNGLGADGPAATAQENEESIQAVDPPEQEKLIKDVNLKKINLQNVSVAAKAFDNFMKVNPQFSQCLENPAIKAKCTTKTATYKENGKDVPAKEMPGDVTKLFYIDGKPIDRFMDSKVKDYKKYSPSEKQFLAKAAIMNALATGKPVDVKSYIEKSDKKCGVKITNLTYGEKGKQNLNNSRYHRQAIKRADKILKNDKKEDEIVMAKADSEAEKYNAAAYKSFRGIAGNPVSSNTNRVRANANEIGFNENAPKKLTGDVRSMGKTKTKDMQPPTGWL